AGRYLIQVKMTSGTVHLWVSTGGKPAAQVKVHLQTEMVDMDMVTFAQEVTTDGQGQAQTRLQTGMKGNWRLKLSLDNGRATATVPFMAPSSTSGVSANGIPTGPPRPWLGNQQPEPKEMPVTPTPPPPSQEGLDLEEAVRLGLSRNPDLLGVLQQLGIQDAALIQAGLIGNPVFQGQYQLADRSGFSNAWEVSLTQNLLDFLLRGARVELAETELEAARLRVARVLYEQSTRIKVAYFKLQADQQKFQLTQTMVAAATAAAELALRQRRANTISQMDLARQQAVQAEAQSELYVVQGQLQVDREELIRLLGTPENAEMLRFQSVLREIPAHDPDLAELETVAAQNRQEVAAARLDEKAARQGYSLASRFFGIDEVRVGVSSAREVEGLQVTGPVVQFPLPVFNQNQGMRARYQTQEKIARLSLASALQNARFEVRQAYRQLQAARNRVLVARERSIPLRHQALKLAEQQFNNMFLGIYGLLTIYSEELEARKALVEALREYWSAHAELEKAVGSDLSIRKDESHDLQP
ncbi:MAG: TolC family protein, partial [Candidatus Eremiobacteraeota bacterium]|nr:TolC family protein [Candidatus Eremiobacteraeota bacterium]